MKTINILLLFYLFSFVNCTPPPKSDLYNAVERMDYLKIKDIVEKSNDSINQIWPGNGYTPLMEAAHNRSDSDVVNILIQHGANVNFQVEGKWMTPLMYAALFGNFDIVKLLLVHGADINTATEPFIFKREYYSQAISVGLRAFDFAMMAGHYDIAKYLVYCGTKLPNDVALIYSNNLLTSIGEIEPHDDSCYYECQIKRIAPGFHNIHVYHYEQDLNFQNPGVVSINADPGGVYVIHSPCPFQKEISENHFIAPFFCVEKINFNSDSVDR
jgi:hypothetical protein